ncbi:MAG: hypothetical protein AB7G23_09270 [Vicinamibacterales bacterium]
MRLTTCRSWGFVLSAALLAALPVVAEAQGRGGRGGPPPTPQAGAPVDFTGIWVSVVSEDWRWRMITPAPGDYANIPITPAARAVADRWDPAADARAGEACRAYAAPAIMREPTRLRIAWRDDYTLTMETDAGEQTRVFQFARPDGPSPAAARASSPRQRSWQGVSVARWEAPPRGIGGSPGPPLGLGPRAGSQGRTLQVETTQIRPGYLRKNGVPFSADATVTEFYDLFKDPDGVDWFVVTTIVRDPQYLADPWVTTSHFKKEPDASKWNPTPCATR